MFSNYEEMMRAVEQRRSDRLIIEVDLGSQYSQEYEDAKKELAKAEAMEMITGTKDTFLSSNKDALAARVEELRPVGQPVWIVYKRLPLMEWAVLMKQTNMNAVDQYESVLNKTFVGIYADEDLQILLSDNPQLLSSQGELGILPGGALHPVVQNFMSWQNSRGEVSIHPTKSGQD